jgi:hypothetical protein
MLTKSLDMEVEGAKQSHPCNAKNEKYTWYKNFKKKSLIKSAYRCRASEAIELTEKV